MTSSILNRNIYNIQSISKQTIVKSPGFEGFCGSISPLKESMYKPLSSVSYILDFPLFWLPWQGKNSSHGNHKNNKTKIF